MVMEVIMPVPVLVDERFVDMEVPVILGEKEDDTGGHDRDCHHKKGRKRF